MKKLTLAVSSAVLFAGLALLPNVTNVIGRPVGDGASIFKAKCTACHGADASGNTSVGKTLKIRDLRSAEVQAQSDAQLSNIISKGKGKMQAYGKSLSQEQIHELVAFIRELGKKR
jgi:cytochrome c oxidase cbb3-type subunit III